MPRRAAGRPPRVPSRRRNDARGQIPPPRQLRHRPDRRTRSEPRLPAAAARGGHHEARGQTPVSRRPLEDRLRHRPPRRVEAPAAAGRRPTDRHRRRRTVRRAVERPDTPREDGAGGQSPRSRRLRRYQGRPARPRRPRDRRQRQNPRRRRAGEHVVGEGQPPIRPRGRRAAPRRTRVDAGRPRKAGSQRRGRGARRDLPAGGAPHRQRPDHHRDRNQERQTQSHRARARRARPRLRAERPERVLLLQRSRRRPPARMRPERRHGPGVAPDRLGNGRAWPPRRQRRPRAGVSISIAERATAARGRGGSGGERRTWTGRKRSGKPGKEGG